MNGGEIVASVLEGSGSHTPLYAVRGPHLPILWQQTTTASWVIDVRDEANAGADAIGRLTGVPVVGSRARGNQHHHRH